MKPRTPILLVFFALLKCTCVLVSAGNYTLVVEGFDWGAAASKAIVALEQPVDRVEAGDFSVIATRSTDLMEMPEESQHGERPVIYAYPSDENGKRVTSGNHATLVLFVSPEHWIGSPMQYIPGSRNQWIDYRLKITQKSTGAIWDQESRRLRPLVDGFDLSGKFTHDDGTSLSYALYTPPDVQNPRPLLIWLHGGGEGGTDPSIALMANRAANYASREIQTIFGGAYVLAAQTPTRWMHGISGETTWGQEEDIYHPVLMALFRELLEKHPGIDPKRIYVGGCSNGGYMSLKLIIENPGFFAASWISALAYGERHVSDEDLLPIANTPIWFVHTTSDPTTVASETVLPLYKRLLAAGAPAVHLSLYDHVVDITGLFGGDGYRYHDHFSWIYHHANLCRYDYDGSPVLVEGRPATIMEWLAAQKKP
jgi:predicted esterase